MTNRKNGQKYELTSATYLALLFIGLSTIPQRNINCAET
jgi:hypothetical protein